jgi:RNA polymerase sigma-70 factor (ECF subfamily)
LPRAKKAARRDPVQADGQERSDAELIEGIRCSNEADFNLLYEKYFPRVYSFAYLRLRNRADTEEVVQDIFTAVFRSIDAYRGQSSLLAWIYGIAKNTVNNHIRRVKAHEQRIEQAEAGLLRSSHSVASCTPEEHLGLRRCEEAIQERLASLADWHTEVFVLRHFEDVPIDEIAQRVSRSSDAVRSSLYRVKKMLVEVVNPSVAAVG